MSSVLNFYSTNVSNTVPSHVFTGISRTRNGVGPLNARTEHLIITRTSTVTNLMKLLEYVPMETSKCFISIIKEIFTFMNIKRLEFDLCKTLNFRCFLNSIFKLKFLSSILSDNCLLNSFLSNFYYC